MTQFGAYVGNETADLTAYENWLGRPVDTLLSFINQTSWKAFDDSVPWATQLWSGVHRPVVWGVPLAVEQDPSLKDGARGAFDTHFQAAASAIAESRADDTGPIYVRLGWEFNGDWMPWAAGGREAEFIATFRRAADIFNQTSDRFQIVWDVNIGGGTMDPAKAYPGDAHVDVVGLDMYYNTRWDPKNPEAAFSYQLSREYGLQWVANFAEAHGKPLAVSEWGVESDTAGPFIENFVDWMVDQDVLYANYWESNAGGFRGEMRAGQYPTAAEEFRQVMLTPPTPDEVDNADDVGTLSLRVSADAFEGDPQFVVRLDGEQVGGIQQARASRAAGEQDVLTLSGIFDAPRVIEIEYLNDAWGGDVARDRNLYVESLRFGGREIGGREAVVANETGQDANGATLLYANGIARFDLDGLL